jgi:hypothetical protein
MKLKTPNKHVTRFVAATAATSMLLPACEPYLNNSTFMSENLPSRGAHAIELDLTKAELDYLRFIQKLSDDIVQHPMIAQAFAQNPQLFLEKYGYNESIDLDEGMLKLTLALGDQDINRAVNAGDIGLVLKLMEERGILNDLANTYSNLNIPEERAKEILISMGLDENDVKYLACTPPVFYCAVGLLLAYVIVAAAKSYVAVATVAAAAVAVVTEIALEIGLLLQNNGSKFLDSNLPLRIWALKGKQNDTYIAIDMYLEDQVDKVINLTKSYSKSFDENKMRDFLKLNLLMQSN